MSSNLTEKQLTLPLSTDVLTGALDTPGKSGIPLWGTHPYNDRVLPDSLRLLLYGYRHRNHHMQYRRFYHGSP